MHIAHNDNHSLFLLTTIDHVVVCGSPSELTVLALQPNSLLSPSCRSATSTRNRDLWVSTVSIKHEDIAPNVMQLLANTLRDANTELSDVVYILSDSSFTSASSFPPQHSTSCILGIPLKSRDSIPVNKHDNSLRYASSLSFSNTTYQYGSLTSKKAYFHQFKK